jgi:hypothetical protein
MGMPLGRYFVAVGSVLLALLFMANWYLPPQATPAAAADVDRTVIRLRSAQRWPERIVIDTSLPTIVPRPVKVADNLPERSPPDVRSPKEAYALLTPARATPPPIATKPAAKRRTRTAVRAVARVTSFEATEFRNPFQMSW